MTGRIGRTLTFLAGISCFLMAVPEGIAQVGSTSAEDQKARASIEKELDKNDMKNLEVTVAGNIVTLTGTVRSVWHRDRALEIALEQEQIEEVDAQLDIAQGESDSEVGKEVAKQVRGYSRFTVFDDVNLFVKDGKVALLGWVTEPYKKKELGERAGKVLGVQELDNRIVVLPPTLSDKRLRQTLANRIYRDSTFSDYASMPIPPIHIIVSNSRVILTGVVRGQLQKTKALSIARQTPGVLSVEDQLRMGR